MASEASAFAGHFGLDNLILIYDSNAVTLDAGNRNSERRHRRRVLRLTASTFRKSTRQDMQAVSRRSEHMRKKTTMAGRKFIISHSLIGKGIPEVAGTYKRMARPVRNLSILLAKDLACPTNIISFRRRLTPTLPSTRRNCWPITSGGKKLTLSGVKKI